MSCFDSSGGSDVACVSQRALARPSPRWSRLALGGSPRLLSAVVCRAASSVLKSIKKYGFSLRDWRQEYRLLLLSLHVYSNTMLKTPVLVQSTKLRKVVRGKYLDFR